MIYRLRIVEGPRASEVIELMEGEVVAGRMPECGIYLPSQRVSRKHCSFTLAQGRCVVRDLDSANGLQVNNHPMPACELVHGTYVQVGDVVMLYEVVQQHRDPPGELTNPIPEDPSEPTMPGPSVAELGPESTLSSGGLEGLGAPAGGFGGMPGPGVVAVAGGGSPEPLAQAEADYGQDSPAPIDPGPPPMQPFAEGPSPAAAAPVAVGPIPGGPVAGGPIPGGPTPQGFGAPPAAGFGAPPPAPESEPTASAPSGNPLLTRLPFMVRVTGLMVLLGLVLLCGPGGGFFGLASGGASNLEEMSVARGVAIAEGLGHRNVRQLASQGLDYELGQWERMPEVKTAYLLDPKGGVVAPTNMASKDLSQDELFVAAKNDRREAVQAGDQGLTRILVPVRGPPAAGAESNALLGYAYIEYDAAMAAGEIGQPMSRLILSFLLLFVAGVGAIGGVWWLADKPLSKLRDEAEFAISGHAPTLHAPVKWASLEALTHTLNRALARAAGMPEVASEGPAPAKVEVVVQPDERLNTLLQACTFAVVLLDSDGRVQDANAWGEHLLGASLENMQGRLLTELVTGQACDRLSGMWQGISQGQAPVLADDIDFGEGPRSCTMAAGPAQGSALSHAVLVVL